MTHSRKAHPKKEKKEHKEKKAKASFFIRDASPEADDWYKNIDTSDPFLAAANYGWDARVFANPSKAEKDTLKTKPTISPTKS